MLDDITIVEGNNELNVPMVPIPPELGATLYGQVTDAETGKGIAGVFVRVIHEKDAMLADVYTTSTDSSGNYLLENMVANVNVYVAFGRSFYQKVEIDSFYLAMGSNNLNVSMVYEGPPEMPAAFVAADFPPVVTTAENFWAGQIVWLKEAPNFNYTIRLRTAPAAAPPPPWDINWIIEEGKLWSAELWDAMIADGHDPQGIRMDHGDGEYSHYGRRISESYATAARIGREGTYTIYSQCKIRERVGKGWHDYGWAWKDLVVGTIKVIPSGL